MNINQREIPTYESPPKVYIVADPMITNDHEIACIQTGEEIETEFNVMASDILTFTSSALMEEFTQRENNEIEGFEEQLEMAENPVLVNIENKEKIYDGPQLNSKGYYQCEFCRKRCYRQTNLLKHVSQKHPKVKYFKCAQCESSFKSAAALKVHVTNTHSENSRLKCKICHQEFQTKEFLQNHRVESHKEIQEYECEYCPKSFNTKASIYQHVRHCHREHIKTSCHFCGKAFITAHNLKLHLSNVHSECDSQIETQIYLCEFCPKKFQTKASVKQHVKQCHREHIKVAGLISGKKIKENENLEMHLDIFRSEERNEKAESEEEIQCVPCKYCSKSFKTKASIYQHVRHCHSDSIKIACHVCGKGFKTNQNLKLHLNQVHSEERNFHCEICQKSFKVKQALRQHMRVVHKQEN